MLSYLNFCPQSLGEKALHTLNVVRAIKVYLKTTAVVRQLDLLFIQFEGPKEWSGNFRVNHFAVDPSDYAYGLKGKGSTSVRPPGLSHQWLRSTRLQPGLRYIPIQGFTKWM